MFDPVHKRESIMNRHFSDASSRLGDITQPVGFILDLRTVVCKYEHSYMGVSGSTFSPLCAEDLGLSKTLRGALVGRVLSNTPAARAGLHGGDQPSGTRYPGICPEQAGGDLITAIDSQPVTTFDDILSYLQRNTSPGDVITLTIWRDGEEYFIDLTLAPRPSVVNP